MSRFDAKRFGTLPNASGTITRLAYAYAKAGGIDPRPLLKKANITLQLINNASLRLNVPDQINFLNLVATALDDDYLGYHLAQAPDTRELGFLYYISASSELLSEALQKVARYSGIANEGVSLKYFGGRAIGIRFDYVGVSRHLDRHQIEFFAVMLVRLCRQLTGVRLVPVRVRLMHRRNDKRSELAEFFGGKIEFGASMDEVTFAPAVKDLPIVSADQHLNKLLITYCEEALARQPSKRSSFHASVENAIVPLLPHGKATLHAIASHLGLSQRTLARRLALEGLTFSAVVDDLKRNLADRYLADHGLSISQVAWLLGYQEVSSLTHAFRRWTGKTPRQARARSIVRRPPIRVSLQERTRRRLNS